MKAELVTTDAALDELREPWNRLAGGDPLASWEWRTAWRRIMAGDRPLAVAAVRSGERIVGLLPGFVKTHPWLGRTLSLLGSGKTCTDYQRPLLDPELSATERDLALELLLDCLTSRPRGIGRLDQIELDGCDLHDESVQLFVDALARRGFQIHPEPIEGSWVTHLPADWDAFVAGVPRSQRRKINKAVKRCAGGEITYHEATDAESIAAIWPEFVRLHELRFIKKYGGGCFSDPVFEEFLRTAAIALSARQAAKIVWVEHLGRPISSQIYLLSPTTAHMYQSGVDPDYLHLEPGHLLFTEVLRRLIAQGYSKLDFLRGDEAYKGGWNAQAVPLTRLIAVAPRATSRWRYGSRNWARSLKRAAVAAWRARKAQASRSEPTASGEPRETSHELEPVAT